MGWEERGVEVSQHLLSLVEAPDQEETSNCQIPCLRGVQAIAVCFERRPRGFKRLWRPAEIARGECDLGLGDNAPRAGHRLFWTEGPHSPLQESLRSIEIAELRHRDASESESRRVLAQGNSIQRAERVTRRQRARQP